MFAHRIRTHQIFILWLVTVPLFVLARDRLPVQAPRPDWPRVTDLFRAYFGDLESFKRQMKENPGLVSKDMGYGSTPLHLAAESNRPQVIEYLVSKGADVNARNNGGYTPLHEAAYIGALDSVKTLVRLGADFNLRTGLLGPREGRQGSTVLAKAASGGNPEIVEFLLEQGAPICYGTYTFGDKQVPAWSALHWAVSGSTNWNSPAEAVARLRTIDLLAKELGDINTYVAVQGWVFVMAADQEKYRIMKHLMENYPELNVNAGHVDHKSAYELVLEEHVSNDPADYDEVEIRREVLRMLRERGAK